MFSLAYTMFCPEEDGGVTLSAPAVQSTAFTVECDARGSVECIVVRPAHMRKATYSDAHGLPDGFIREALEAVGHPAAKRWRTRTDGRDTPRRGAVAGRVFLGRKPNVPVAEPATERSRKRSKRETALRSCPLIDTTVWTCGRGRRWLC